MHTIGLQPLDYGDAKTSFILSPWRKAMTNGAGGGHGRKKAQSGSTKKEKAMTPATSRRRQALVPPSLRKRAEQ